MKNSNTLIERLFVHSRKTDSASVRFRWSVMIILVFVIWTLNALIIFPSLSSFLYRSIDFSLTALGFFEQVISSFFAPQVLFLLFIAFLGGLIAYEKASIYFFAIYGKTSLIHSNFSLWNRIFGPSKKESIQINLRSIQEKDFQFLKDVGGPARIIVPAENAVILEKLNGKVQIVGPTLNLPGNCYVLDNFEIVKEVIDLQDQSIRLDLRVRTKDGHSIIIKNLHAVYCIQRITKTSSLTRPFPFSASSIYSLYYKTPVGTLPEKFGKMIKSELIRYIRRLNAEELIPQFGPLINRKEKYSAQFVGRVNFCKRLKYEYLLRKPISSFFIKQTSRKLKGFQRKHNNIHSLYLDHLKYSTNENQFQNYQNNGAANLISSFRSQIAPILEESGFQLIFLSIGSIEAEHSNKQTELKRTGYFGNAENELKESIGTSINKRAYEKNELRSFLKEIDKSVEIMADHKEQEEFLTIIHSMIQSNLNERKGKSIFHNKQLDAALKNLNELFNKKKAN